MSKFSIVCDTWRPLRKNTLQGFVSITIGELEVKIHDVAVHQKADQMWAALPARPWVKDGAEINRRPEWAKDLPIASEGHWSTRYGK